MKGIRENICHAEVLRTNSFENYVLKKIYDIGIIEISFYPTK